MTESSTKPRDKNDRVKGFVLSVIARCKEDKGLAARLRRADNPATEYQSWETLAGFGISLEIEDIRLPYATIAAFIARQKPEGNGGIAMGTALAQCYPKKEEGENGPAKAKLRRLLACADTAESCRILRPILTLIQSRVDVPIDYVRLLRQLLSFHWRPERIKTQWAQEFYGAVADIEEGEVV